MDLHRRRQTVERHPPQPEGDGQFPGHHESRPRGNAEGIAESKGREFVRWGLVCIARTTPRGCRSRGRRGQGVSGDFSQFGARPENIRRALACLEILISSRTWTLAHRRLGHSMGAFVTIALAGSRTRQLRGGYHLRRLSDHAGSHRRAPRWTCRKGGHALPDPSGCDG